MKRLAALFILFPLLFLSQSGRKYPGLLWKISGNGLKKSSYLYGTMHVSNRVAYYLSEEFFDAIKSVDVVGLETNPGEWLENMEKTGELGELTQLRNLNSTTQFYKGTFTVAFPEKRMLQGILSYDPDIINGLLYRQNKSRENFEESTYIDLFIFQSASKLNKKIISLENFAQSEIMARLSSLPDEEQSNNNKNASYYTNAQKIEDAYREGNLDMIDSLSKLASTRNTQKFLINERNIYFVNTIDSVLKHQTLFSGVGAAHLPGEDGVIELLRKKGYTVEPVSAKVTRKSNATREKLDLAVKPVSFSRQYSADSLFSVNLPGKLYPIVNTGQLMYYIHADMVNGSFYTVVRLRHNAPLFGVSPEQMMLRIDSMLFENIPGKILVKREITAANGIKGVEIINRIRRGDEQHYQIYFTDSEMIMFKLGGKQDYASSGYAREFFQSVQFKKMNSADVAFSPPARGFSVTVPTGYNYLKYESAQATGLVEDLYGYSRPKESSFGVRHAVYNDFTYLEEDTFELNQLAKNILSNYSCTKKSTYNLTREQNVPCISFSGAGEGRNVFYGRVYIKGVHYYLVYQHSTKGSAEDQSFFNGFSLTDFRYLHPLKEIADRDIYFKAIDEVTDNALSRFNEAYVKAYDKVKKNSPANEKKSDYAYRATSKFYYSPSSNEYVCINFEKYNDYDYRDPATISKRIEDHLKSSTSMYIASHKESEKDGIRKFFYTLKDTGTSRAIDVRVYFRNGMMHQTMVPYDTVVGMHGWTAKFVESFTPLDTAVGKNIFENKFRILLNDLTGTDTLRRRMARESLEASVTMQKAFTKDFVAFINSPNFNRADEDSKAQLFVNGGLLGSDEIIAPYTSVYKQYTDSFYLQMCILKGLALNKTSASYNAFLSLLLSESPLVGDENTVIDVFNLLHDSLQLCREFFPRMLDLTRYDEYRNPVYSLLAALSENKIIAAKKYEAKKDIVLADATLALKRYTPGTRGQESGSEYTNIELNRTSKELAENILLNLDGLNTNNHYKNKSELRSLNARTRPSLVNYAVVLSPFYKTDARAKEFITKLSKVRSQQIAMPVFIDLLKQDIMINDTLLSYYSKNVFTRAYFYSELEKAKLQSKFEARYLTQRLLVESVLKSQNQLSTIYGNNNVQSKNDTLALVREVEAGNKYQKGRMYIYRQGAKQSEERWHAVFVSDSGKKVTSKIELVTNGYYTNPSLSEEENINELLSYFSLSYRKRALANNNGYN